MEAYHVHAHLATVPLPEYPVRIHGLGLVNSIDNKCTANPVEKTVYQR
jgi:metal-sulfur cluster biosynthetic enzyme